MAQLATKIKLYANREIDFTKDVKLQDNSDGKGAFIAKWNLDIPKPTLAQLDALENEANKYERNQQVINTRKSLYGSWEKQLEEINENGIDSWKARIANIKLNNPKE
jgi:pullulanase/glycogen debranching enzyme